MDKTTDHVPHVGMADTTENASSAVETTHTADSPVDMAATTENVPTVENTDTHGSPRVLTPIQETESQLLVGSDQSEHQEDSENCAEHSVSANGTQHVVHPGESDPSDNLEHTSHEEHGEKSETSKLNGSMVSFHRDADLKIIIQESSGGTTEYMVCSSALACASPKWRSILYHDTPHARESDDEMNGEKIQSLKLEGNADALALIFRIVHYDFGRVSWEPTLDQLFEIGKAACDYHCTHLLQPWAQSWTSSLKHFVWEPNCYMECHKALNVAWTFGDLHLFRDMVDALIVSSEIDDKGNMVNISGQRLEDMYLPADVEAITTTARVRTITNMLDAIKSPIMALSTGERVSDKSYCRVGKDSHSCEAMMLGSAIPALTQVGLFPVPDPLGYTDSISTLRDKCDKIKTIPYVGKDWMPHMSHDCCNLGFSKSINACLKQMDVPLTKDIMSWMSDQAKICGIEATKELAEWRCKSGDPSTEDAASSDFALEAQKTAENGHSTAVGMESIKEEELEDMF